MHTAGLRLSRSPIAGTSWRSAAFLTAVRQTIRVIRGGLRSAAFTSAEQRQYEGWCRREAANGTIRVLVTQGVSIKVIVRHTGQSRKIVREVLHGDRTGTGKLWRRLRAMGFPGALRVVTEWATRRRTDDAGGISDCVCGQAFCHGF